MTTPPPPPAGAPPTPTPVTSAVQDAVWLLSRRHGDAAAFTVAQTLRVTGPLRVEVLRAAWCTVLDRHEVLRTVLVEEAGRPVPRVTAVPDASFRYLDGEHPALATTRGPAGPEDERFDLARGPLARLIVRRHAERQHTVTFVAHQVVADHDSVPVVLAELSLLYAAGVGDGDAAVLPEPPRYADHARRERDRRGGDRSGWRLDSWAAELGSDGPASPGVGARASTVETVPFDWGAASADAVRRLARVEGATPPVVLLAALQAVLARHRGESTAVVGLPVTCRPDPAGPGWAGGAVGPYRWPVPVGGDLGGGPTFRDLVRRLTRGTQDAMAHPEPPFRHPVGALGVELGWDRPPLCDATLSVDPPAPAALRLAGAAVEPIGWYAGPVLTDVALTVTELTPGLAGTLSRRGDPGEPFAGTGLLEQVRAVLSAGTADPDRPVSELPLETVGRSRAMRRVTDAIEAAAPADRPVPDLIRDWAQRLPDAPAIGWDGGEVSYRELVDRAATVAALLRRGDGVAGAAVAIRMSPGPWQVAASVGVLLAGGHLTWFSPTDTGARGRLVLTDLRPAYLLLDADPGGNPLAAWYAAELAGRVVNLATALAPVDAPPAPPVDPAPPIDPAPPVDPAAAAPVETAPAAPVDAALAYVAYTSGSTGRPKGIAQSHAALTQFVTWMADAFDLGPGSRVAQWAALEHDPSLCETFATLVAGGTLCPVPAALRAHPERLLGWLARERITMLQVVPSFARELLTAIEGRGGEALCHLRHLIFMGEALPARLAERFRAVLPEVRLVNLYGPTETIAATWYQIAGALPGGTVPVGMPLPGRQVQVLDERDRPCPAGVVGEIVIRSRYAVTGYVGDRPGQPPRPGFRPVRGGPARPGVHSYRTGDLGRWGWDGQLHYLGRRDEQVKLAGTRVELAEVRAALAEHESVADCAVVPVTDPDGLVTFLAAYVVPRRSRSGQPMGGADGWRAHLRRRFGRAMTRLSFTVMAAIPRNIGGKVDRDRLPPPPRPSGRRTPHGRTRTERELAGIWRELLGAEPGDVEQTFFAAGGHSRLLPPLVALIRERLGVDVPLWTCAAGPSLAGLAAAVDALGARTAARAAPDDATAGRDRATRRVVDSVGVAAGDDGGRA